MTFNVDYGSVFSVLLSQEDIFVEIDPSKSTACFDLTKRILYLPVWQGSREMQRWLMSHEVAHAIFTPALGWIGAIEARPKEHQIVYMDILNVFEDARIDRLMQQKYIAMKRWYYEGTHEATYDLDIWKLGNNPQAKVSTLALIDRINLYYKTLPIANPFNVSFEQNEQIWIERTDKARTFKDIKKIADDFFDQLPKEEQESAGGSIKFVIGSFEFVEGDPKGEIAKALDSFKKEIGRVDKKHPKVSHVYLSDPNYVKFIHNENLKNRDGDKSLPDRRIINMMVSVFQRKKNAKLFSKTLTTKTGILDPLKLHAYRLTDDIMLRQTIIDKQKNHGFIMIVDMSGSMLNTLPIVIEHLYVLAIFCKILGIPFESYGFQDSDRYSGPQCDLTGTRFDLVPILNNAQSQKEIESTAKLWKVRPAKGGTPLTSAIHHTKTLTLSFKERHRIDVMNVIFLTDGSCTKSMNADVYTDKASRMSVSRCEDFTGKESAVGPLMKILRARTHSNVWAFHIKGSRFVFEADIGGTTGTYFIPKDLLKKNITVFVQEIMNKMSEYGGTI